MLSPLATPLSPSLRVYTFRGDRETSHLLVSDTTSLLIDCHTPLLVEAIVEAGLPLPDKIVHTHIAPEHCCEGRSFPKACIHVHQPDAVLAFQPEVVRQTVATQIADLTNWGTLFGREPFGIAGRQTEFPPEPPLPLGETFSVGNGLAVGSIVLEVIALPFHGRHAVGLIARDTFGKALALFCGDLLVRGGYLVDAVSTLDNYINDRFHLLPVILKTIRALGPLPLFPSTGEPIIAPEEAAATLALLSQKMERYLSVRDSAPELFLSPEEDRPSFGRFCEVAPGIYQLNQFGNAIVLVHFNGGGLLVDPGPCDFGNPDRENAFLADLAALEAGVGLQTVDLILITHYHGDHVDLTHLVRRRYPSARVATWERIAEVLEHPEAHELSAKLPWYGLDVQTVSVDEPLPLGPSLKWYEHDIELLHLPGHAWAHVGFLLTFRGKRLAITGDAIQLRTAPDTLNLFPTNDATPAEDESNLGCYRQLVAREIDLNLGGHGSSFTRCREMYSASIERIETAIEALTPLFEPGRLRDAYRFRRCRSSPDRQNRD